MVAFEGPLEIKVIGSAANMIDFVAHSKKSLGIEKYLKGLREGVGL